MVRSHEAWWWQGPVLELLAGRSIPHLFVPAKMFSCVSGLDVPQAVLRSLPYLESVILYLLVACFGPLDLLPCPMETDHYDFPLQVC